MNVVRTVSLALVAAAATLVACGGSDANSGATFGSGAGSTGGGSTAGGTTSGSDTAGTGGTFGDGTATGGGSSTGGTTGSGDTKCASVNVKAELVPVYLVVMFDKSGSMDDNQKWTSCSAGLKSFFGDAKSTGMSASLQFFPQLKSGGGLDCSTASYTSTKVPMTALPNTSTFPAAIDATGPSGSTPTLPAITGAIAYAQTVRTTLAASNSGKVAVVLVTDGEPNGCSSSVDNVSAAAAAAKANIPTYVIGVGDVNALDQIAAAGGTTKSFTVSTSNPAQTSAEFGAALATIRGAALSCEYKVPDAPAGKTLDLGTVNVVYTTGAGTADTLAYSKDCATPGWHYDNPSAPTKIQLCTATCNTVKADNAAKVSIELGCATKGTDGQIPR